MSPQKYEHLEVPLKVRIKADENLASFLARLAERNAYDRATWLSLGAGERSVNSTNWNRASLAKLATLTGLPIKVVTEHAYVKVSNGYCFFGETIPRGLLQLRWQKYCPDCLREDGFQCALFDLTLVWACPRHARQLSNHCPECLKPLRWGAPGVLACPHCRADLRSAETKHIDPATLTGLVALARRAGFSTWHPGVATELTEPPAGLAHLNLGAFATLMAGLASYCGFRGSNGPFLNVLQSSRDTLHNALSLGWRVIKDWPNSFDQFLDHMAIARRARNSGQFGIMRDFGPLIDLLRLQDDEPWSTVDLAFREYLTERWDGDAVVRRARRTARPTTRAQSSEILTSRQSHRSHTENLRRLTLAEVERRVGRSSPKVAALLASEGLRIRRAGSTWGAPLFIEVTDINKIAPEGAPPFDLNGVAKYLAISRKTAKCLVDADVIRPVLGPSIDKSKTYIIPRTEPDNLVMDIMRNFQPRLAKRSRNLSSILKGGKKLRLPIKSIIDAMRSGQLSPIAVNGTGLCAFEFDPVEVRFLFVTLQKDLSHARGLPVLLAAKYLRISMMSVLWLVKEGHLQTADNPLVRISLTSLHSFSSRWIKLGTLADRYGTSRAFFRRALECEGVKLLSYPGTERYGVTYFNRRQLDDVNVFKALSREKGAARGRRNLRKKRANLPSPHKGRDG